MRAAIDRRVRDSQCTFRVIPALLPGANHNEHSRLPDFLMRAAWVNFEHSINDERAFHTLVAGIRGQAPGPSPAEAKYQGETPYRGLEFFDVKHAPFYFGRNELTSRCLGRLQTTLDTIDGHRFLAIIGPSGSGKSSLARAGLVASLQKGMLEGSDEGPTVIMRPGSRPLESLADSLAKSTGIAQSHHALRELVDGLLKDQRSLHFASLQALRDKSDMARIFLLVDQFEEVFTDCADSAERQAFFDNLLYASTVPQGKTTVVMAMRADFYGKCAEYPRLASILSEQQVLVGPMTDEELRQAIEEPARRVGCELESGLTERLLSDVRAQPGSLPLMQDALLELWKNHSGQQLKHEAYESIGGISGALERRASALYDRFSLSEQVLCQQLFLRLVRPGEGTEDTRCRVTMTELLSSTNQPEVVERVVARLADSKSRLLTTHGEGEQRFVEVAHEALIRSWGKLKEWLNDDREGHRIHHRLTRASQEWDTAECDSNYLFRGSLLVSMEAWATIHPSRLNGLERRFLEASLELQRKEEREAEERQRQEILLESERRSKSRLTRLSIGLVFAAIIALSLAGIARYQGVLANDARARAEADARARATAEMLAVQREDAAKKAAIAESEAHLIAESKRQEAEKYGRIIQSGQFAAQAQIAPERAPQRSLLLAIEALNATTSQGEPPTSAAQEALWNALANTGGIGLGGHGGSINSADISPNGRWLATGSADETVRIWDLSSEDPSGSAVVLREFDSEVSKTLFSPDGRWFAASSRDGLIRLWSFRNDNMAGEASVLKAHEGPVASLAFSPDGHWLASGGGYSDDTGVDPTVKLWDLTADDLQVPATILKGHTGAINAVEFSPDGRWLASAGWYVGPTEPPDTIVLVWDLSNPKRVKHPVELAVHRGPVQAMAFSLDGRWLATGAGHNYQTNTTDNTVRLWDLTVSEPWTDPILLTGGENAIASLAFSPNSRWLAVGSSPDFSSQTQRKQTDVHLWEIDGTGPANDPIVLGGFEGSVSVIVFSSDNRWLCAGGGYTGSPDSERNAVQLWDLTSEIVGSSPVVLTGHEASISALLFDSGNNRLISTSWDGTARLWDLQAENHAAAPTVLQQPGLYTYVTAMSADGRWLASDAGTGTIRLWDMLSDDSKPAVLFRGHARAVTSIAFSPDNQYLLSGSWDGTARLWNLTDSLSDVQSFVLRAHGGLRVGSVDVSPDGRWAATGGDDNIVRLWDLMSPDPNRVIEQVTLVGHSNRISVVRFSPDGQWLATTDADGLVRLWNMQEDELGTAFIDLQGHKAEIEALAFSPDGRWLATGAGYNFETNLADNSTRLWNLTSDDPGANSIVLRNRGGRVSALAFSSSGRWLATGAGYDQQNDANDYSIMLWNLEANTISDASIALLGHDGEITALAFDPSDSWLGSGSSDHTVRIWDLRAQSVANSAVILKGHAATISNLFVRDTGRWLISSDWNSNIRLWNLDLGNLVDAACHVAGRNLSQQEWKQAFKDLDYRRTCATHPIHPSVVEFLLEQGANLARIGDMEGALTKFAEAQALDPSVELDSTQEAHRIYAIALVEQGKALARDGDATGARRMFQQALDWDPELDIDPWQEANKHAAQAILVQARTRAEVGDLDGAEDLFRKALRLDTELAIDPEIEARTARVTHLVQRGSNLVNAENYEEARNILDEAIELDQNSADAYGNRGVVYYEQKLYALALDDFDAAISLTRRNRTSGWLNYKALAQFRLGNYQMAEIAYRASLLVDSSDATVRANLGYVLCMQGQVEKGLVEVNEAIRLQTRGSWPYQARGGCHSIAGRYVQAQQDFARAIEIDPENEWLFRDRADVLRNQGKFQEAIDDLTKAISIAPDNAYLVEVQADLHAQLRDYSRASDRYATALAINPQSFSAYQGRANLYLELEDFDRAVNDYARAAAIASGREHVGNEDVAKELVWRARTVLYDGKYETAMTAFTWAAELDPSIDLDPEMEIAHARAESWVSKGDWEGALAILEEADLSAGDNSLEPKVTVAQLLMFEARQDVMEERYEDALETYERAMQLDPTLGLMPAAQFDLDKGDILAREGRLDEAIELFREAQQLSDDIDLIPEVRAVSARVEQMRVEGRLIEARQLLENTLENFPNSAQLWLSLGIVYYLQQDWETAIETLTVAERLGYEPTWLPLLQRGHAYWALGDLEQAIADYSATIDVNPNSSDAFLARADIYHEQEDLDRAIDDYGNALDLVRSADTFLRRGHAFFTKGNYVDAVNDYSAAIDLGPSSSAYLVARGNAHRALGNIEAALEDYNRAVRLAPTDASAYYARAQALFEKGNDDEAIVDWQKGASLVTGRRRTVAREAAQTVQTLGYDYATQGRLDEAQRALELAIELDPLLDLNPATETLLTWSRSLAQRGEIDEALAVADKVLEEDPNLSIGFLVEGAVLDQAASYVTDGQYEKASDLLAKGTRLDFWPEGLARAYLTRWKGYDLVRKGKIDAGLDALKEADQLDPSDWIDPDVLAIDVLRERAWEMIGIGRYDEATAALQEALRIDPSLGSVPAAETELGKASEFTRRGLATRALVALNQAVEIDPGLTITRTAELAAAYYELCAMPEGDSWTKDSRKLGCERAADLASAVDDPLINWLLCENIGQAHIGIAQDACNRADELMQPLDFSQTVSGTVRSHGGDLWTIEVDKRQAIVVELNSEEVFPLFPKVVLYSQESQILPEFDHFDDLQIRRRVYRFLLPRPGTYLFSVQKVYSEPGTYGYVLRAEKPELKRSDQIRNEIRG
jgi:WD40 repeat protein/Tfp pilus assembly protein PilF